MIALLAKKAEGITRASIIVGAGAVLSRLFGLLRDRILASQFGAGIELDIYYAAFRIPDVIYGILILGAISAAFIPLLSSFFNKDEEDGLQRGSAATRFASEMLTNIVSLLAILSLVLFLFAPLLMSFVAPGLSGSDRAQAILLTRIMLLQPVILGMSNVLTGMLQAFGRFVATSLAPSFYNIGIIIGALFFVKPFGLVGLAFGVVLGALLHLLIQLPAVARIGFSFRPTWRFSQTPLRKTLSLMGPRVLAVMTDQVNLVIITAIASTLALGSITIFYLAQNIGLAPVGIIGITIATAAFPSLSRSYSINNVKTFLLTFARTFRLILFFSIPFTVLFILLRAQIVRVILGAGQFSWEDTRLTAAALGLLGFSLFAQALIPLFMRVFYSMHDTKTPLIVGALTTALNVGLAFLFLSFLSTSPEFHQFLQTHLKLGGISDISVVVLPLAFSLAMLFEFFVLFFLFFVRFHDHDLSLLSQPWYKTVFAAAIMGIVTFGALRPLSVFLDMETGLGVFLQGFIAGALGFGVYFLVTALLKENPFIGKSEIRNPKSET